jgi:hypothetical protein
MVIQDVLHGAYLKATTSIATHREMPKEISWTLHTPEINKCTAAAFIPPTFSKYSSARFYLLLRLSL